jgi:hypothetical protein
LFGIAFLAEGKSPRWILLACAAGLAIVPVAWRRKAAVNHGAIFATSADYLPGGQGRRKFPGVLSVTSAMLTWSPSGHSISKGSLPLTLAMGDCTSITMKAGPALLDVIITVERRNGGVWLFLTHRSLGLRRAIASLSDLIPQ